MHSTAMHTTSCVMFSNGSTQMASRVYRIVQIQIDIQRQQITDATNVGKMWNCAMRKVKCGIENAE